MIPRALRVLLLVGAFIIIGSSSASAQEVDPAGVIFAILILAVPIGLRIAFCAWIFLDAGKRGISAAGWILLTIFFPLIGIILYVLERDKMPPAYYYYPYPYQFQYNPYSPPYEYGLTGSPSPAGFRSTVSCRGCRAQIQLGSVYCPFCGARQR